MHERTLIAYGLIALLIMGLIVVFLLRQRQRRRRRRQHNHIRI